MTLPIGTKASAIGFSYSQIEDRLCRMATDASVVLGKITFERAAEYDQNSSPYRFYGGRAYKGVAEVVGFQ